MLSSKQRAVLRGIVSKESSVFQIGKDGLTENGVVAISQALASREVIKINVLQNSDLTPKSLVDDLETQLNCEVVGTIGRKIILYRFNPKNKNHVLKIED